MTMYTQKIHGSTELEEKFSLPSALDAT